ncbi:hypothetical protein [Amycolatopsis sp. NPDC059657]|uniref:hypothetical protein n=1 Tax=Amycolatopsis sp. NPDC059657 TaxID=3346899 RepID=UPI00366D04B3
MDLTQRSESFAVDDTSWLGSRHGVGSCRSVTLDTSAFTPSLHYPDGFFKSGLALGRITASGLYGPYGGTTDEVQTLTVGGSGLTSFTITWNGQTTSSLVAAATAAQVQAALEALSNIGVGDVTVTGSAGGPWTVTFGGALADTNVAAMTTTPTGGTGVVNVATTTAGGADGSADGTEVFAGFLMFRVAAPASTSTDVVGAMLEHGRVVNAKLPIPVDAAGRADAAGRIIFEL